MKQLKKWVLQVTTIFSKAQKKRMVGLILLMVFVAVLETLATTLMLPLMNSMIGTAQMQSSATMQLLYSVIGAKNSDIFLIRMSIIIAIIYILKGILLFLNNYLQQKFVADNRKRLSKNLFNIYIKKPYSFHLNNTTADVQRAVITDVDWYCYFINALMILISELFVMLLLFIVLIAMSPQITIMAMILLGTSILITSKFISKKVREAGEQNRIHSMKMAKWVQQTVGALKSILINKRENYFSVQFQKSANDFAYYNCQYMTIFALPRIVMETVSMAGIFIIMAILLVFSENPQVILPVLATFAIAAVRLMPSAKRISDSLNQLKYYAPAVEKIYKVIGETNKQAIDNTKWNIINTKKLKVDDIICIQNVIFGFDNSDTKLYHDFSLEIPLHHSTAFIGQTGSGKTTLVDIILGLHQPEKGDVKVGGVSIFENREWWAKQIGYIPQSIYLCDDTIKKNIAFGYSDEDIDDNRVWKCLEDAQLDDFVRKLPKGIDTITGENGIRLSGGQRQRIGIARALYSNPQILVLDEATSALDSETEKAIMDAIQSLSKEKTLIIIAHRLSTIKDCDYIYTINKGTATKTTIE